MKIQNIEDKKIFELTSDFFQNAIVAKGNGHKYIVLEDDAPIEVRKMLDVIELKKKQSKEKI